MRRPSDRTSSGPLPAACGVAQLSEFSPRGHNSESCATKSALLRLLLLVVLSLGAVGGCGQTPEPPEEPIGFYVSSRHDVLRTARVVFIELAGEGECTPELARQAAEALAYAIQQRQLFRLDIVARTDPMCRDLPLDRLEALTLPDLSAMRSALRCDAVLFGHVSQFQPYPRMKMGLVLKLINLKDGKLVWGVDHTWDTADRTTEWRIRSYFDSEVRSGYDPLSYELVFASPRAFQRYVAHEVARTLPDRHEPPQPVSADAKIGQTGTETLK